MISRFMITKKKLLKQMKIRLLLEAKRTAMSKFKWPIKLTKFGMVLAFTTKTDVFFSELQWVYHEGLTTALS